MTVIKLAQFEARGISSFIFTITWATTEDGDDKNHKIMRVGHDIMIFDMYGPVVKLSIEIFLIVYNFYFGNFALVLKYNVERMYSTL